MRYCGKAPNVANKKDYGHFTPNLRCAELAVPQVYAVAFGNYTTVMSLQATR
jgi:hypothetical protein